MLIIAKGQEEIWKVKVQLDKKFEIKDLKAEKKIFGMEIIKYR